LKESKQSVIRKKARPYRILSTEVVVKEKVFTVIVERDPESGWLVGDVAELPGCYTQAPDLPELEKNVQEAIRACLKVAGSKGPTLDFIGTLRIGIAV
jgi:predicted RNase H-like HicB family nuclease